MIDIDILEKKRAILVTEFAAKIPPNAQVVLQVEGDGEYNKWVRQLAGKQREPEQAVVFVKIKGLKPVKSRLIRPEATLA